MGTSVSFWDRIAKGYSKKPVANQAVYDQKLKLTQEYLKPETELFEFGCGTGTTAIYHAPFVSHVHAIDVSSKMLEIAQNKTNEKKIKNIKFERATIEQVIVPDHSYDVVLGLSILHLLEDREAIILKTYRMLKPGGVFVTSTVCLSGAMNIFRPFFAVGTFFRLLPLIRFITPKILEQNMIDAGFHNEVVWHPENSDSIFIIARKPSN